MNSSSSTGLVSVSVMAGSRVRGAAGCTVTHTPDPSQSAAVVTTVAVEVVVVVVEVVVVVVKVVVVAEEVVVVAVEVVLVLVVAVMVVVVVQRVCTPAIRNPALFCCRAPVLVCLNSQARPGGSCSCSWRPLSSPHSRAPPGSSTHSSLQSGLAGRENQARETSSPHRPSAGSTMY